MGIMQMEQKKLRFGSFLEIEDYIAVLFVAIVGALYLYTYLHHQRVSGEKFNIFYYFLLPLALVILKETLLYFWSQSASAWGFVRIFRDWFPFMLILGLYYSFYDGVNQFINLAAKDRVLADLDAFLFGGQISIYTEKFLDFPGLADWLSFAYFSFIFIPALIGGFFYFKRDYLSFKSAMLSLVILEFFGCLGYLLVPAIGPLYAFPEWYTMPVYSFGSDFNRWMENMHHLVKLPRDCFPSLHTAISALFLFSCWPKYRWLFFLMFPLVFSLWVSTVMLRYHYLVDVLAGLLLAAAIYWLQRKLIIPYYKKRLERSPAFNETFFKL
ncbi:MAG: phosphatase PAP2 family protein [Candidatus Wallbacteria bacterium]|nr:phosphatase PAP2 family protein [Candidatus Wallbacteria bacterium]